MNNFIFRNETKIIFGENAELKLADEVILFGKKVMLHYGGHSIRRLGLYERILKILDKVGVTVVELSGVQSNPRLSLVQKGIDICKSEDIDIILAVGGGSVIDSAKAIAVGTKYDGNVWDIFQGNVKEVSALPVGAVLTIPAAGSETNCTSVLTNEDGWYKRSFNHESIRPKFAVMNPKWTYSLSPFQTATGCADIMSHVFERYFTNTQDVELTDRLCEATLRTVINNASVVLKNPENYAARAEIMWANTVAHNGFLGVGREEDWGSHMIAHELGAIYDIVHGATLTIVFPAWMKYVYKSNINRFAQFKEST